MDDAALEVWHQRLLEKRAQWLEAQARRSRRLRGEDEMPSKSKKQARLMAAAAHDPAFAAKVGVPVKVAKEYNRADARSGILKQRKPKGRGRSKG